MKEIKFRAKKVFNGKWVIGYLIKEPNGSCWIDNYPNGIRHTVEVVEETVGQYLGSKDLTGVEVYESDVGQLGEYTCVLKFNVTEGRFWWVDIISNQWIVGRPSDARIIGNIYDNPELSQMDVHESNSKSRTSI